MGGLSGEGVAFQNFDLSGRWRNVEYERYVKNDLDGKIEWRGVGESRPVGALPRGEAFTSFAQFKELLVKHYARDVVRGLMKNLMLYGTGSKPDVAAMAEIQSVLTEQEAGEYPLRDLVKAIVRSRAFLQH